MVDMRRPTQSICAKIPWRVSGIRCHLGMSEYRTDISATFYEDRQTTIRSARVTIFSIVRDVSGNFGGDRITPTTIGTEICQIRRPGVKKTTRLHRAVHARRRLKK